MTYKFSLLVCLTIGYISALTPIKASSSQRAPLPAVSSGKETAAPDALPNTSSSERLNTQVQRVDPFGLIQLMQHALNKERAPVNKKPDLIKADVSFLQTCFTPLHTLEFNIKQFVSKEKSDPKCKNNKEILLNALKEISMQLDKELNTVKAAQQHLETAACISDNKNQSEKPKKNQDNPAMEQEATKRLEKLGKTFQEEKLKSLGVAVNCIDFQEYYTKAFSEIRTWEAPLAQAALTLLEKQAQSSRLDGLIYANKTKVLQAIQSWKPQ